ncbi:LysR family transcriptional regulator [Streptomyces sp. DSM 44917]|uniref:LysR family transcriptional regulator n=1 Tax=Streptomyces boetiae TaxID=3075541 RepID=A0ABU2L8L3_9ACTN|nr:LysR family transcriptional regulator [Streptomyces sp. DSM 44917]MDT0307553.1 LysR family transcriptional regulator [Streptomyces sp. DSM 44917]
MTADHQTADHRHSPLDLRLVRYAVVLSEELHFGRAAARLFIAQQTLSAQIGQLERRLDATLFLRDRRSVTLTPAGRRFVERGRRLLDDAADLVAETGGTPRPVRIDVIAEGLTSELAARELRTRLPGIPIEIMQNHGLTASVPQVQRGELDLAFGRVHGHRSPLPAAVQHRLAFLEPLGIAVPAGHPLADLERVPVRDLSATPLLLHTAPQAEDWADWNERFFSRFGFDIGHRLHGHGRGAAHSAVLAYGLPSVTPLATPPPPGLVARPLYAPVPLCPVSVLWASPHPHPVCGLDERVERLLRTLDELADEHHWRTLPPEPWWMPDTDLRALAPSLTAEELRHAT